MKFFILAFSLFVTAGCGKEPSSGSSPSPNAQPAAPNTEGKLSEYQVLKIYDGSDQTLNSIQAVNVSSGHFSFDFHFKPLKAMELSLPPLGGKFYLVDCKESDVATYFEVFRVGSDGILESPTSFPISVIPGIDYVVRVNLYSRTSCLGIRYSFAIQRSL